MNAESRLVPGEVHIWQVHLGPSEDVIRQARKLLSPDEIERADRFYFEKHRRSFIAGRSALRRILCPYLGLAAQELAFSYGAQGKPELNPGLEESGIKFNLSHSGDWALLAVTRQLCLGVDIERVNHEFGTDEIATRFFSPTEVATLQALPAAIHADAFFSCWTRKEAYIKAVGGELSIPLDSFDVAFGPGVPAALLRVEGSSHERWTLYDVPAPQGYKAALVIEGKEHKIKYLVFSN